MDLKVSRNKFNERTQKLKGVFFYGEKQSAEPVK